MSNQQFVTLLVILGLTALLFYIIHSRPTNTLVVVVPMQPSVYPSSEIVPIVSPISKTVLNIEKVEGNGNVFGDSNKVENKASNV